MSGHQPTEPESGSATARVPKYPECEVRLVGTDGNAFAILGKVRGALRQHVNEAEAEAFFADSMTKYPSQSPRTCRS